MSAQLVSSIRLLRSLPILVIGRGETIADRTIGQVDRISSVNIRKCERLIRFVRLMGLPIAHALIGASPPSTLSESEPWRPLANEMVCDAPTTSIYSCEHFDLLLRNIDSPLLILAGAISEFSLLTTDADARLRGHRLLVVRDALLGNPAILSHALSSLETHPGLRTTTTQQVESWAHSLTEMEYENAAG